MFTFSLTGGFSRGDSLTPLFLLSRHKKSPRSLGGLSEKILTLTYSHMGKPHTTIGEAAFHF